MILANETQIARFTGKSAYPNGNLIDIEAAIINLHVAEVTKGMVPCYVSRIGARGAPVWVSVGSSGRIGKGEASRMLERFGVDNIV